MSKRPHTDSSKAAIAEAVDLPSLEPIQPSTDEMRFLACAMAHDARNPLNTMAIHIELASRAAAREPPDVASLERSLIAIEREMRRTDQVLTTYLDVVAPKPLPFEDFALAPFVERVVKAHAAACKTGAELHLEVASDLAKVAAVPGELELALAAVLRRAIWASLTGHVTVVVARIDDQDMAAIDVATEEADLPAAELAQIFQLGHPAGGAGALPVAKQAVSLSGGVVSAHRDGKRTVIRMCLAFAEA